MKTNLPIVLLFVILFLGSCTPENNDIPNVAPVATVKVVDYKYNAMELQTMFLINEYRKNIGLNVLKIVDHISFKSAEHADYMIVNNVVNHDDFKSRAENIIKVLGAIKVSENIAYNFNTPQAAFEAWMNSLGHKENIKGDFTHFGIAIRENPVNGRKYFTNIFVKI
jgi:uncharacterized protein YkwD